METLFKQILTARVYDAAQRTPLDRAAILSAETGCEVLLKREDLQPTFAYKVRGACNKIAHLTDTERQAGVLCASAGNHAQGVAFSARRFGLKARVVMPVTTPQIKIQSVKALGAQVILHGENYSDAADYCQQLLVREGGTFIHPFDDPLVIAGQGTIGHEIFMERPDMDAVFVPVGGGGLISGVGCFLKTLRPGIRVVGVEPEDSDAMAQSLAAGKKVRLEEVGLFADGVAVREVGEHTFRLARQVVDEIVRVSTDEICSAIKAIHADTRAIMEPAGALGVAGLRKWLETNPAQGKTLVAVNSGANMNFERLQFVAERTLTGEHREALFAVSIPERPRALRHLLEQAVGEHNITELHYRLSGREQAHIFMGVSVAGPQEVPLFKQRLAQHGYQAVDLTRNELAKTHLRHMVGGHSPHAEGEVLYRFQFPERPQALGRFLSVMGEDWNISLFHYRSHGGDFGRVLVGFEIPPADQDRFQEFLRQVNYHSVEETRNEAYKLFL
ncbi:MAG: threonine ammonia-lyase, biosynthetic [Deltaproteobacteria bacterium]|nr:threonine ammonia-lyase, biosynthetic [Deltaproteobacteria bacterium]